MSDLGSKPINAPVVNLWCAREELLGMIDSVPAGGSVSMFGDIDGEMVEVRIHSKLLDDEVKASLEESRKNAVHQFVEDITNG